MPSFDAGSIEATLTLDRSPFNRELEQARADGERFERQRFTSRVDLDTDAATRRLDELKLRLNSLGNASSNISLGGAAGVLSQLQAISEMADRLDGRQVRISVDVGGLADVEARLLAINHQLDRMDRDIDPLGNVTRSANSAKKSVDLLLPSIVALAPAMASIGTVALGALGGFTSMLGSAGGALGVYGGVVFGAIKLAQDHKERLEKSHEAMLKAQAALAKTKAGTEEYNRALAAATEAERIYRTGVEATTEGQQGFYDSTFRVRKALGDLTQATDSFTLGPVNTVLNGTATLLTRLRPLIEAVGSVAQTTANHFAAWAAGPGGERFISFLTNEGVPVLSRLMETLRNFVGVIGHVVRDFNPMAQNLSEWLLKISGQLLNWGEGGGFTRFMQKTQEMWPPVREALRALWEALERIFQAMEAMAPVSLALIQTLGNVVSAMPPWLIQAIVDAWLAWKAAMVVTAIASGVSAAAAMAHNVVLGIQGATVATTTAATLAYRAGMMITTIATHAWTAAQWLLNAALTANPIALVVLAIAGLVAAIVWIATKTTWFQTAWEYSWNVIKEVTGAVWRWIYDNVISPMITFFTQHLPTAWRYFSDFWEDRWNAIRNNAQAVWNFIINNIWNPMVDFFTSKLPTAWRYFSDFWEDRWNALRNNASAVWNWIVENIWNPMVNFFTVKIPEAAGRFKDLVVDAFQRAKDAVGAIWDGLKAVVAAPVNFVINTVYNDGIRKIWNNTAGRVGLPDLPEGSPIKLAEGGPVPMTRTAVPGKDSVPIIGMPGEHMLTTEDVNRLGGHAGVFKLRRSLYMADGGPVPGPNMGMAGQAATAGGFDAPKPVRGIDEAIGGGLQTLKNVAMTVIHATAEPIIRALQGTVDGLTPDAPEWATLPSAAVHKIGDGFLNFLKGKEDAAKAAAVGGGYVPWAAWGPGDGERVHIGTSIVNRRTAAMLANAAKLFGRNIEMFQGSYNAGGVMASAGTHDGGGAVDVGPAVNALVGAMRASGFAAWLRTPDEGFAAHIHGIAVGDKELSPGAAQQVAAFFAGRNGLADNGPDTYRPPAGGAAAVPTEAQLGIINQALSAANIPPPGNLQAWQTGLATLISRESGWNASAVNNTDSNAAAGTPSIGLAQVIQPTFDAYKAPGLGNIWNPVANVAAAARYIAARYGDITNVQQANPNKAPAPYWDQGWINEPVVGYGKSGRQYTFAEFGPEYVSNPAKTGAVGGAGSRWVKLVVGEREFQAYMEEVADSTMETRARYDAQSR